MAAENLRKLLSTEQLAQMDAVRDKLLFDATTLDKRETTHPTLDPGQDTSNG